MWKLTPKLCVSSNIMGSVVLAWDGRSTKYGPCAGSVQGYQIDFEIFRVCLESKNFQSHRPSKSSWAQVTNEPFNFNDFHRRLICRRMKSMFLWASNRYHSQVGWWSLTCSLNSPWIWSVLCGGHHQRGFGSPSGAIVGRKDGSRCALYSW